MRVVLLSIARCSFVWFLSLHFVSVCPCNHARRWHYHHHHHRVECSAIVYAFSSFHLAEYLFHHLQSIYAYVSALAAAAVVVGGGVKKQNLLFVIENTNYRMKHIITVWYIQLVSVRVCTLCTCTCVSTLSFSL